MNTPQSQQVILLDHLLNEPDLSVALDNIALEEALTIAKDLKKTGIRWIKIGLELFTRGGPDLLRAIKAEGLHVFLDLKCYDIPNTVFKTVQAAAQGGADLLTVHCSGGTEMLTAAGAAAREARALGKPIIVVGVTVLTSLKSVDINKVYLFKNDRLGLVSRLVLLAAESGLDGVVISAPDLAILRSDLIRMPWLHTPLFVTPGIRRIQDQPHDQDQTGVPEYALKSGAHLLVVGRPIMLPESGSVEDAAKEFLSYIPMRKV